jgi:6-phosphogluconolactonase
MFGTNNINETLFVVCYGDECHNGRGIAKIYLNHDSGELQLVDFLSMTEKPGAVICLGKQLWVSFLDEQTGESGIDLYQLQPSGFIHISRTITPYYYSSFHQSGSWILAASFRDGADAVMAIDDPAFLKSSYLHPFSGPNSTDRRQQACHSHFIATLPHQEIAYATDLGTDQVLLYRFVDGVLTHQPHLSLSCAAGSGPRLMPSSADGRFAYLLHELSNHLQVLEYSATGFICRQSISVLAENSGNDINSAAACQISPDGRYLLVSVRGDNSLVIFHIDPENGRLTLTKRLACGHTPRDLLLRGTHILVAAQGSNQLESYPLQPDEWPGYPTPPHHLALQTPIAINTQTY